MKIQCINCGQFGHIYKNCKLPIESYGIICLKLDDIKIENIINISKILNQQIINKNCIERIKKFKILLNKIDNNYLKNNLKFLLIKRRNTIAIIEFIRGKYTIKNYKYLLNLFYQMTNKEKYDLLNYDFDYN